MLFADVQLQPEDDSGRLIRLGLALTPTRRPGGSGQKFAQPCAAFDRCRCRIYDQRPQYCRDFQCLLLGQLRSGATTKTAAVALVRKTRRRAAQVRRWLRELGDTEEQLALSTRLRRTTKRVTAICLDPRSAHIYSLLTQADHDLNLLLSQAFYPAP